MITTPASDPHSLSPSTESKESKTHIKSICDVHPITVSHMAEWAPNKLCRTAQVHYTLIEKNTGNFISKDTHSEE